jgi:peptidoglycan/xylan/chitin deacetylase (PgdA/CDA1 family)
MEHGRFSFSGIAKRPPLHLPNGAKLAVWVAPNVEHYEFNKPAISLTPMTAGLQPDILNYAWRDYGARVGIWRLMEIFDRHAIPITAALNSDCCKFYPEIVSEGTRLGWEWMAHGKSNSVLLAGQSEENERQLIKETIETITAATGKPPRGWLSPALTETFQTLDILAGEKIDYVADWCNDEQPYLIKASPKPLVALPYTLEVGDIPVFMNQGASGEDFYRIIVDQFDTLIAEAGKTARIMSISLHPFLTGHPFRAKYLDKALAYMRARDDVWFATGSEITDWYTATNPSL